MSLPFLETAAFGAAESATAVLPLSMGGHAALLSLLFDVDPAPSLRFSVMAGTWLAAVAFFRTDLAAALREGVLGLRRPSQLKETRGGRDATVIAIATAALLVVGLSLQTHVEAFSKDLTLVGAGLLLSALAVASTFWAPNGDRETPTAWGALIVGAVQGAAVLPGLSRTAVALASLLWLGVRARRALTLAFLMAIPAETALLCVSAAQAPHTWLTLLLTALVAGVGLLALLAMRRVVEHRFLPAFSLYLVPLSVATLAWGYARP